MDWIDLSYLAGVSLAAAGARALRRGLPPGWRLHLEAEPPEDLPPGWIWLHAVSVGELILASGLIGWLREEGHRIHVTAGTPAGLELMAKRLPVWDQGTGRVSGGAFPVDDRPGLEAFLRRNPGAFVALETELWPNLLRELELRGIPRIVVNGRLTDRSLGRGGPWMRRAASRLSLVAARDPESARRFEALGAPRVELGGNLKADLPEPAPLHEGWEILRQAWRDHPILVAGNTVEGEEALVLALWRRARAAHPELRLVLAPRQPRRFPEVGALFTSEGLRFHRASAIWPQSSTDWRETDVLLLDTLGELPLAYREGTVALVGGGWTWGGGHNPLEPVRWNLPTLIGPGYANFQDLVEPLREASLLEVVPRDGLEAALETALAKAPARPGFTEARPRLPEALQGALGRTCSILKKFLPTLR